MTLTPALVELHAQAAGYYLRRREPGWTGADERELNEWLAADPARREIFDGLSHTFHDLSLIRRPRLGEARAGAPPAGAVQAPVPVPPRRRVFAPALLALALLMAGGGWYAWDNRAGYTLELATGPGETRSVELPDGSRVALNFDSALQVRYYPRRRETVLARGEAFFQVAADARRPFSVDSGASQVRVLGTAFNVRAAPPELIVKVLEGRVEVRPDRRRPGTAVLQLGARSGVAIDPATGTHRAVAAVPEAVGDWRNGQLVFEQTPLREVAGELARYLGQPVRLEGGAGLAALPVSGVAVTASPQPFLQSLPHLLPVNVQARPEGGWRIVAR